MTLSRKYLKKNRDEQPVIGRVQLTEPEPLHAGSGYYFPKTLGPDGLAHYDCPMERGVEPCRCGARALQGDWRSSFDA